MIGPLEILIVLLIVVIVFGGYKWLPQLGRSAGKGVRTGGEKTKELAATVSKKAESIDTDKLVRTAGDGMREARELRESLTGSGKKRDADSGSGKATAGSKTEPPPPTDP